MKAVARNTAIYSLALWATSAILPGVKVTGGLTSFVVGGFLLYILFLILKPILSVVSIPLNILTLGIFSSLTNVIIFYLLTVFLPKIEVMAFTFSGYSYAGFTIPQIHFNTFFAFIAVSITLSIFVSFITWLINK